MSGKNGSNPSKKLAAKPASSGAPSRLRMPRQQAAGNRWSAWAFALAARHQMVSVRPGPLAMLLARSRVLAHILQRRWTVAALNLHPKLILSIHPIVRESLKLLQQITALKPPDAIHAIAPAQSNTLLSSPMPHVEYLKTEKSPSSSRPGSAADQVGSLRSVPAEDGTLAGKGRTRNERLETRTRPPLSLVFQRLYQIETCNAKAEQVAGITRDARVIKNSQRFERGISGSRRFGVDDLAMTVRQLMSQTTTLQQSEHQRSFTGVDEVEGWTHGFTKMPEINVNDLAEQVIHQIDQRATAWRERMGKT